MAAVRELPAGYEEIFCVDLKNNKKQFWLVNGLAVLLMVGLGAAMHPFVPLTTLFSTEQGAFAPLLRVGVYVASYLLYIVLHEAVHGVAMRLCGTKRVRFGFAGAYAFAGSDDHYTKRAYIFIALAPVVLWGVVLGLLCCVVPLSFFWVVYLVQIGNIGGAAGDFYVSARFLFLPRDILVKDAGISMKVYSAKRREKN